MEIFNKDRKQMIINMQRKNYNIVKYWGKPKAQSSQANSIYWVMDRKAQSSQANSIYWVMDRKAPQGIQLMIITHKEISS